MIYKTFDIEALYPQLKKAENKPLLFAYLRELSPNIGDGENHRYPVMVVLPGGGYSYTSDREADPIALQYFAAGYHTFILRYSCVPDRYPTSLLQVMATIHYIRTHADELHADPERVFVVGFSAGGHLAASAGTLWKDPVVQGTLGCDAKLCRPTGMILSYPVISSGEKAHRGSFNQLLGPDATQEQIDALSLENRVDEDTCPAFLWHTFTDGSVPVENTLYFTLAMRKAGVPCEVHIYPFGGHGLSVCNKQSAKGGSADQIVPHAEGWMDLSIKWLGLFDKE
ncbi:MAG: alpha/beta hydrolase [Ruminococcaceae bacterium]|nr:alpha/beta hydrolase [Oscillospiraceae bacterium]